MTNSDNSKLKEEENIDTKNLVKSRELLYRLIIR